MSEFYFNEELSKQAYELMLTFGKIAVDINGRGSKLKSHPEYDSLSNLGDIALHIGATLLSRIPPAYANKLGREHRNKTKNNRNDFSLPPGASISDDPFLSSQQASEIQKIEKGKVERSAAEAYTHFMGRPLSTVALTKILFTEGYDSTPKGLLNYKCQNYTQPKKVVSILAERGLELVPFSVPRKTGKPYIWRMATTIGKRPKIGLTRLKKMHPSDDELRDLAFLLRRPEGVSDMGEREGEFIKAPEFRKGMYPEWAASTFIHFRGLPIWPEDFARLFYGVDTPEAIQEAKNRAFILVHQGLVRHPKTLGKLVEASGRKIVEVRLPGPSAAKQRKVWLCVGADETLDEQAKESLRRPSADELIEWRKELWRRENEFQQTRIQIRKQPRTTSARRIKSEMNSEWKVRKEELRDARRRQKKWADGEIKWWYLDETEEEKDLLKDSKKEIRWWKDSEALNRRQMHDMYAERDLELKQLGREQRKAGDTEIKDWYENETIQTRQLREDAIFETRQWYIDDYRCKKKEREVAADERERRVDLITREIEVLEEWVKELDSKLKKSGPRSKDSAMERFANAHARNLFDKLRAGILVNHPKMPWAEETESMLKDLARGNPINEVSQRHQIPVKQIRATLRDGYRILEYMAMHPPKK